MLYNILAIFTGGGLGAVLRYLTSSLSKGLFGSSLFGTFAVNLLGCFLIGLAFGFVLTKSEAFSPILRMFIITGFLGGLTTFSTFSFEIFEFIKSGNILYALLYLTASCVLGLIFVYIGYSLAQV